MKQDIEYQQQLAAYHKECDQDYQDYLEWPERYVVPDDSDTDEFMLILFWWGPVAIIFLLGYLIRYFL
jgi:hypothetical protein